MQSTRDAVLEKYGVEPNWIRYARAVQQQRAAMGLTQEQVTAIGGPSTASLRLIEGAMQESYRPRTLYSLDRVLGWAPGSHLAVLAGAEPEVLMDAEAFRRSEGRPEAESESVGPQSEDAGSLRFQRPTGLTDAQWDDLRRQQADYWDYLVNKAAQER